MSTDLPPWPRIPRLEPVSGRLGVRLPTWLGDAVMAAPTTEAIAGANPDAEIVAFCRPGLVELARLLPGVSEAVDVGRERGPGGILAARRAYRDRRLDALVVMPRGTRAMLGPGLAGVPVRLGFGGQAQRRVLTHAIEGWRPWRRVHRTAWLGLLARAFGVAVQSGVGIAVPDPAREEARAELRARGHRDGRALVVLEPGAAYGAAKCWPVERYADLARRLRDEGRDVAVVGTAPAAPLEAAIASEAEVIRLVGRTPSLAVLAGILAEADLVVANDTGPMHLAAGVGTPVVAIFGATDPEVSAPAGPGETTLLTRPAPCSPCFRRVCDVDGHPCMTAMGTDAVLEAANHYI